MRCQALFLVALLLLATSLPSVLAFRAIANVRQLTDRSTRHGQPAARLAGRGNRLTASLIANTTYTDCGSSDAVVHTVIDPTQSFSYIGTKLFSGAWTFTVKSTIATAQLSENAWYNGQPMDQITYDWLRGLQRTSDGSVVAFMEPITPGTYTYTFSQWSPNFPPPASSTPPSQSWTAAGGPSAACS